MKVVIIFLGMVSLVMAGKPPSNLRIEFGTRGDTELEVEISWDAAICTFVANWDPPGYYVGLNQTTIYTKDLKIKTKIAYWEQYVVQVYTSGFCPNSGPTLYGSISPQVGPLNPVNATFSDINCTSTKLEWKDMNPSVSGKTYTINVKNMATGEETSNTTADTELVLTNLIPNQKYHTSVTVWKLLNGTIHSSTADVFTFESTKIDTFPFPYNIRHTLVGDLESDNATISWQIDALSCKMHENIHASSFNVSLYILNETSPVLLSEKTVTTNEVLFTDLAENRSFSVAILPIWLFNRFPIHGSSTPYRIITPHFELPEATKFQNVPLSPWQSIVAWVPSLNITEDIRWTIKVMEGTHSDHITSDIPKITLNNLKANKEYVIEVGALFSKGKTIINGKASNFSFVTMAQDYGAPQHVTYNATNKTDNLVSYEVSFQPPTTTPSEYYIIVCEDQECKKSLINSTHSTVELKYFTEYVLHAVAVYKLPLNETAERGTSANLTTIGRAPSAVRNLSITNITSTSVSLKWQKPSDYSQWISDYRVIDPTNQLEVVTEGLSAHLRNLSIFHLYHLQVIPRINFTGDTYLGPAVNLDVTTDSGVPGPVENVNLRQVNGTNMLNISFGKPKVPNGPIDAYILVVTAQNGDVIINKIIASTQASVAMPTTDGANYTVAISAQNIGYQKQAYTGPATKCLFTFAGLARVQSASVIGSTSESLTILITAGPEYAEKTGYYFSVSANGSVVSPITKDNATEVVLGGLKPYTNETILVRACYNPRFCSDPLVIYGLTNVGAPSEVVDLKMVPSNGTNVAFQWKPPMEPHGPLKGYLITLRKLTDPDASDIVMALDAHQTNHIYETADEWESYNVTVQAFNVDLKTEIRVSGKPTSVQIETTGIKPAKPVDLHCTGYNASAFDIKWKTSNVSSIPPKYFLVSASHSEAVQSELYANYTNLTPYTNYTVYVSGCTSVDQHTCGYPRKIYCKTDVDAPSKIELTAESITTESMNITWKRPEHVNGPLDGYELLFELSGNNASWTHHNSTESYYAVSKLTKASTYVVCIRAYNINQHGEKLMSEKTCLDVSTVSPGMSGWLIALITCLCVAALGGVGFVVYKKYTYIQPAYGQIHD